MWPVYEVKHETNQSKASKKVVAKFLDIVDALDYAKYRAEETEIKYVVDDRAGGVVYGGKEEGK